MTLSEIIKLYERMDLEVKEYYKRRYYLEPYYEQIKNTLLNREIRYNDKIYGSLDWWNIDKVSPYGKLLLTNLNNTSGGMCDPKDINEIK